MASQTIRYEASKADIVGELTTEHAASSYGQPVLVVDGTAYGADDIVVSNGLGIVACELVFLAAGPVKPGTLAEQFLALQRRPWTRSKGEMIDAGAPVMTFVQERPLTGDEIAAIPGLFADE